MKNQMPFEQFNDSYLKKILQNSENLNRAYTSAFSKISGQISGIDQRFTGRARLLPYSELLENLSGKSRLFAYSELLENLSGKSRLMPQDKLIQNNLYIDLNKQISSWQKLLQPSVDILQPSRQLKEILLASRVLG